MSGSRRPDKGQQASRLLAPSAGRPPRTPGDNTSACDGRGKSAPSGGRAISSHPGETNLSPQGGGDQGYQTSKPAGSTHPGCSDPGSDTKVLGSDIIAGLTSTGNYVSLKYDPSLGHCKSRGGEDGTSPGKLTGESKTVVDNHIQVSKLVYWLFYVKLHGFDLHVYFLWDFSKSLRQNRTNEVWQWMDEVDVHRVRTSSLQLVRLVISYDEYSILQVYRICCMLIYSVIAIF